jgi:hypothetical protein
VETHQGSTDSFMKPAVFGAVVPFIYAFPGAVGVFLGPLGKRFIHRVAVLGNYNPARLQLLTCSLDAAVECTLRIEGCDYPSCWHAVLSKIAVLGNVAYHGTLEPSKSAFAAASSPRPCSA